MEGSVPLVGKADCLEEVAWHGGTGLGACSKERQDHRKGIIRAESNVCKGWGEDQGEFWKY